MDRILKVLAAIALLGAASGCTTQDVRNDAVADRPTPTHRWIADMDVSRAKYNFDNNTCAHEARDSSLEASDSRVELRPMRRDGAEFTTYERCMEGKGYSLATY